MRKCASFLLIFFIPVAASAQQWTDVTLLNPPGYSPSLLDGQTPASLSSLVLLSACNSTHSYCAFEGLNIQSFASTSYVNSQLTSLNTQLGTASGNISALNTQISGLNAQLAPLTGLGAQAAGFNSHLTSLDTQISSLQAQLYEQASKANELAVIAGAMRDAIPNPGDRYALRVNLAGASSQAAGGASFSANLDDSFRVSLGYGRGQKQDMFSGGLNFSFN